MATRAALGEAMDVMSGVVGALAGAVIGVVGTYFVGHELASEQNQLARPGQIQIDPIQGTRDLVGRTVLIRGTAQIPRNTDLQPWIVVRVDVNGASTYYPQGAAVRDGQEHWHCLVSLGGKDASDDGPYEVFAALVDGPTAARFGKYVHDELATDTDGIADYPSGKDLQLDSIALQRDIAIPGPRKQAVGCGP